MSSRNKGSLYKNDYKKKDTHPDYVGKLYVSGVNYKISAWIKTNKKNKKYLSLSLKQVNEKEKESEIW